MLIRNIKTLLLLLLLFCFSSCVQREQPVPVPNNRVVLVYLGGDNNLGGEVSRKTVALMEGWNPSVPGKLLVYQDRSNMTPALIEICSNAAGETIQRLIEQYPEEDSASPEVFGRVVKDVKQRYPADSYGLVIFSHATGWLPKGFFTNPYTATSRLRTIINDKGNEMEISQMVNSLNDASFDFIIFEACHMSGIEVAYALRNKTKQILCSSAEIVSPGFETTYARALPLLFEKQANLMGFGKNIFQYYKYEDAFRSGTFSLLNTERLTDLRDFVAQNCNLEQELSPETQATMQCFSREDRRQFFDFEEYYTALLQSEEDKKELSRLVDQVVVWRAATDSFLLNHKGFQIKKHSGMTVYIPQNDYVLLNLFYKETDWYKALKE